uniref:Kazal-like domain-containing protein n=1 Tax=Acrobeloides nanus TaxID=290746 RepID=A0A914BV17_9BILA
MAKKPLVLFVIAVFITRISGQFNFTLAGQCSCPMKIEPVCGSIGGIQYTFMNRCILNCTQHDEENDYVFYHYDGPCCRQQQCTMYETPVCDHRGQVYDSKCKFEYAQCIELKQNGQHLAMNMDSPACQCVKQCQPTKEPVCDSTGRTHSNLCAFMNAKCIMKTVFDKSLELDYMGPCCENLCSASGYGSFPVCDTENNTHPNLCAFLKYRCRLTKKLNEKTKVGLKSFGVCRHDPEEFLKANVTLMNNSIVDKFL